MSENMKSYNLLYLSFVEDLISHDDNLVNKKFTTILAYYNYFVIQ